MCCDSRCSSCLTASDASAFSAGAGPAGRDSRPAAPEEETTSPARRAGNVQKGSTATSSSTGSDRGSSASNSKARFEGAFSKSPVVYADEVDVPEIAAATVNAQPIVVQEPALRPKATGPKKPSAALSSAIGKIKSAALGTAAELKEFRKFLKPMYTTPGEAYDDFAGDALVLDRGVFYARLEELGYRGNYERLFNGLRESDQISREAFKQRLVAVGRTPKIDKNKRTSFGSVVVHAVETMKEEKVAAREAGASVAKEDDDGVHGVKTPNGEDASKGASSASSSLSNASAASDITAAGQRSTVSRWNRNSRRPSQDGPARRPPSAPQAKSKPPSGRQKGTKLSVLAHEENHDPPSAALDGNAASTGSLEYSFDDKSEPNSPTLPDSPKPVRAA